MTPGELAALPAEQPLLALTIASILLGVLAGMIAGTHPRLGVAFRNACYLGLTAALLLTVAGAVDRNERSEAALWLDRTRPAAIEGGQTVIAMRADGHFWVEADLNGDQVEFLVDTGATYTGVSQAVAQRVGLMPDEGDNGVLLETANGTVLARMATARTLRLGAIEAIGLPVAIGPESAGETNVIGMNFLSRLASWRVEGRRLILTPHAPTTAISGENATNAPRGAN